MSTRKIIVGSLLQQQIPLLGEALTGNFMVTEDGLITPINPGVDYPRYTKAYQHDRGLRGAYAAAHMHVNHGFRFLHPDNPAVMALYPPLSEAYRQVVGPIVCAQCGGEITGQAKYDIERGTLLHSGPSLIDLEQEGAVGVGTSFNESTPGLPCAQAYKSKLARRGRTVLIGEIDIG